MRRRAEGIPLLEAKYRRNLARRYSSEQQHRIYAASSEQATLEAMPVNEYVDLFTPKNAS